MVCKTQYLLCLMLISIYNHVNVIWLGMPFWPAQSVHNVTEHLSLPPYLVVFLLSLVFFLCQYIVYILSFIFWPSFTDLRLLITSLVSSNFFLFRPSWSLSYHVVVEFTSCAISAYYHYVVSSNPTHCEVYSIQYYVIKFVSDLRQVIHPFSIT
jgi:hypothetical protein